MHSVCVYIYIEREIYVYIYIYVFGTYEQRYRQSSKITLKVHNRVHATSSHADTLTRRHAHTQTRRHAHRYRYLCTCSKDTDGTCSALERMSLIENNMEKVNLSWCGCIAN